MGVPSNNEPTGRWRRWLMAFWVILSIAFAAYVGIAAPLLPFFAPSFAPLAIAVPPLMVVLLLTGLAWLVLLGLPKRARSKA